MILIIESGLTHGKYHYKLFLADDEKIIISNQTCLKFQIVESLETPVLAEVDFMHYDTQANLKWPQIGEDGYLVMENNIIMPDQVKKAVCLREYQISVDSGLVRGFFGISSIHMVADIDEYKARAAG